MEEKPHLQQQKYKISSIYSNLSNNRKYHETNVEKMSYFDIDLLYDNKCYKYS